MTNGTRARAVNIFEVVLAVVAQRVTTTKRPFPAAQNTIYGTAFAISESLYLTAGHVVRGALADGDLALAHVPVTRRVSGTRRKRVFALVEDHEIFFGIDVALLRCSEIHPIALSLDFERLPIFQEVRAGGVAPGPLPEYYDFGAREFKGHIVNAHRMVQWPTQPFVYDLSFVPPRGFSGAPVVRALPSGPSVAGIVLGVTQDLEGSKTRLGLALAVEELLRVESRLTGGPFASFTGSSR
jgi:hypothetical protein